MKRMLKKAARHGAAPVRQHNAGAPQRFPPHLLRTSPPCRCETINGSLSFIARELASTVWIGFFSEVSICGGKPLRKCFPV
jgi:hypothetical protein